MKPQVEPVLPSPFIHSVLLRVQCVWGSDIRRGTSEIWSGTLTQLCSGAQEERYIHIFSQII